MDKRRPEIPLPTLKVGTPVVVQSRQSRKWDKFGVIQDRNVRARKYMVRLPSGMLTVRTRRHIRQWFPPLEAQPFWRHSHSGGTAIWAPFGPEPDPPFSDSDSEYNNRDDELLPSSATPVIVPDVPLNGQSSNAPPVLCHTPPLLSPRSLP